MQRKADRPTLKYASRSPVNISSSAAMSSITLPIALTELFLQASGLLLLGER